MDSADSLGDYPAWLYEQLHCGDPEEVQFYCDACPPKSRVLELGCGFGRILLPLAERGCEVTGLELHPGLAARCEERLRQSGARATVLQGDMVAPPVSGDFDRILIPYNTLYCLDSDEKKLACLCAARALLDDDGLLILDAYVVLEPGQDEPEPETEPTAPIALFTHEGREVTVLERNVDEPARRRLSVTYTHLIKQAGCELEVINAQLNHHYLYPDELLEMLRDAGLEVVHFGGGFEGESFGPETVNMVIAARRSLDS